ncbi:carbohydrate ABC transporter permease [Bifidobacterium phasiani]|uniref:Maltose/maltodextrin transport system permease protein n=1 Tax=Bifidobacterium phasiani TaxID=2834431 RepID=A0ABS6W820_9BIFI|nr:sugar ABC transporter permease [Bifidobacterium phasiani]MBW3082648.1 sugar ABC transporter permease [Bifidobacterium phasiani]
MSLSSTIGRLRGRSASPDDVAPSPYTVRAAFRDGDAATRLSAVVLGLGNLARGQVVKGLAFLAVEIGFVVFIVRTGVANIAMIPSLGWRTQTKHMNEQGYWLYDQGDNSVIVLLYGVATLFIIAAFVWFWTVAVRSAYKAQKLKERDGAAPTLVDDLRAFTDLKAHDLLLGLPVAGVLGFTILPTLFMMSMAFTSYDSDHVQLFDWVGLENFTSIFGLSGEVNAGLFGQVLAWTLVWAFFATFLNFFFGTFLAMAINRKTIRGKGFWRALFSLSMAVPQFVSLLVMRTMLQQEGIVNRVLSALGWIDQPLPFFTDPTWARVTVIVINLWVGIPFTIMQVTGILQNIPAEQYEAARIDGANWWQTFVRITMPYMLFVLTPYLITTFTANVNNFNVIYLLSGGDPTPVGASAGSTDLLVTWLYKLTVDRGDYNIGAVIGIFTFVVLAVVSLITYRSSGSYKNEGGFR